MSAFSALKPLNITKRSSRTQCSELPFHERSDSRDVDQEKLDETETSEYDSDYSSYPSSPVSSRETSGSCSSNRPMLRKSTGAPRTKVYKLPQRIVRYLCLALISTIVIFMLSLVRASIVSSRKIEVGDYVRPPPPPPVWESFEFLSRYYGGIRTLLPASENKPEYPLPEDKLPISNQTLTKESTIPANISASNPFKAYRNHSSEAYLSEYAPVRECFLDAHSKVRVPQLQFYNGRPSGFPENVMGSYDLLGLPEDVCFERYGRLGPYGLGYSLRSGGTGASEHGDVEGSETVWADGQIDYRKINWADAQKRCFQSNIARFEPKTPGVEAPTTFSILAKDRLHEREEQVADDDKPETTPPVKYVPRTAVVIRTWDEFEYREEDILHLRAMISELSLGSGGEYDVHLLVQVRDEAKHPIWADEATYQQHLRDSVPEEFQGITTLWSVTQMLMLYQGIFDNYVRGPDLPAHGSYRGLQMAIQHFAHRHSEYDFFWHWEMDIRYTGHYYDLFSNINSWTKAQPRKGLWERSSRFYVPSIYGTWEDFKQMVRVQTEMGTEDPTNVWSSLKRPNPPVERSKGDTPIWGPERPSDPEDWFEIENDPKPPTSYEKDKYVWGVGEEADLITLNPLFDPEGTSWYLASDITGYNTTEGLPPRRAAIVTSARMSRRLLTTMHRETAFKNHHAFSEMWAPTTALHHGYKAVYVPHPMFVDREWPTPYLASIMNAGRNGASGGAKMSVFGEREHNLKGMTWYYDAGFAPNLWKRWLGLKVDNEGGEEFETVVNEGRSNGGKVDDMKGGEGRMCLPPMLIHPVKGVELPIEGLKNDEMEVPESDPSA